MTIVTPKPVDLDDPSAGLIPYEPVRGIVVYWRTASPQSVQRRRRNSLQLPYLTGGRSTLASASCPGGPDEPPRNAAEQLRFVQLAYALVACKHPVPSDAEVYYQVWSGGNGTAGFCFR